MPVRTVSQRFSHLQWRRLFKELWGRQQRLQILDLHFDKFPTPATFACWKIRFKTEVYLFAISNGSDAMDQRSGDGGFIGLIMIFVIFWVYFNAEF